MEGLERNIRLLVEYDGSSYHGFQAQDDPSLPTIQDELEKAIAMICKENRRITGSGRTDAGAHALGQVVNFYTRSMIPIERLPLALNSVLSRDIRVKQADMVSLSFHARFDAIAKTYSYLVDNRPHASVFLRNYVYHVPWPLDMAAMERGAELLVGTLDYASFQSSGSSAKTSVRTVSHLRVAVWQGLIRFDIRANGFLYNMVRNIVGTLLEVGKGKIKEREVAAILDARDRTTAGPTVPARGLYLVDVEY